MVESKVGSNRFVLQGFVIGFKNSFQPETCTAETIAINIFKVTHRNDVFINGVFIVLLFNFPFPLWLRFYYDFSDAKTVWNFLMMIEIHHRSFIRIVDHTVKKSSRPFLWSLAFYLPSISLKTFYVAFIYDAFKPLYFRSFLSRKKFGFKIFSTFSKAPWSIYQSINGRDVIEKWNRQR